MHEPSHAICKQDVDFLRLNQRRHLALTKCGVHHGLSGAISARLVVGRTRIEFAPCPGGSAALEAADSSAFRTRNPRNLAPLG